MPNKFFRYILARRILGTCSRSHRLWCPALAAAALLNPIASALLLAGCPDDALLLMLQCHCATLSEERRWRPLAREVRGTGVAPQCEIIGNALLHCLSLFKTGEDSWLAATYPGLHLQAPCFPGCTCVRSPFKLKSAPSISLAFSQAFPELFVGWCYQCGNPKDVHCFCCTLKLQQSYPRPVVRLYVARMHQEGLITTSIAIRCHQEQCK